MLKYSRLISFILFAVLFQVSAQVKTSNIWDDDNFAGLKFRSIGPAFMSGRISDIAIHPEDFNLYLKDDIAKYLSKSYDTVLLHELT